VITLRGYQLDIAIQLPAELKNTNVSGLMGNFNDEPSDDLTSSTGLTIDPNSTETVIYNDFGETCELFLSFSSGGVASVRLIVSALLRPCYFGISATFPFPWAEESALYFVGAVHSFT